MRKFLALILCHATLVVTAQTEVRNTSYSYAGGVYPTYSVVFTGTEAAEVEKWFKDKLKSISSDMGGKKEVMSIGTRLPEVSSDTVRVFVKADHPKRSPEVTVHVAFRVNNTFVGPDSEERQREGCRNWVYQHAVALKKSIAQKELEAGKKRLSQLEGDLAALVKEKGRAEGTIEKAERAIIDDEKEKEMTQEEGKLLETKVEAQRQAVVAEPTEENSKELKSLEKERDKLKRKGVKLAEGITASKRKIEDLGFQIQQNLSAQQEKSKAIEAQKLVVEGLTTKLAGIN